VDTSSDKDDGKHRPSIKKRLRTIFLALAAVVFVLGVAALSIPVMDGPHSRRNANEAVAVGHLRRITTLQTEYATSHATKGFSCELAKLKTEAPPNGDYDTDQFLMSGTWSGYNLALTGCEVGPDGEVVRYRVTAVPREPGKSGVRAFCTDQSGLLWYDSDGSGEKCLASRRLL
jgi:hypothetical protein